MTSNSIAMVAPSWTSMFVRTNIRNNFPRAKEGKRIKVHGWKTRMSTPGGRKILMRRILKGRHVLSHWGIRGMHFRATCRYSNKNKKRISLNQEVIYFYWLFASLLLASKLSLEGFPAWYKSKQSWLWICFGEFIIMRCISGLSYSTVKSLHRLC